jgi:hypothetical protein
MKVLRHQNPADQSEAHLAPNLLEDFDKVAVEAFARQKRGATIGAAGEKL